MPRPCMPICRCITCLEMLTVRLARAPLFLQGRGGNIAIYAISGQNDLPRRLPDFS